MPNTSPKTDYLALETRLSERLPWLSYFAFAVVARRTLAASGLRDIRFSDRRSLRGRSGSAGVDLRAVVDEPLGEIPVLVQLKLTRKPIGRRSVDQLRSRLLAEGTSHGIIIAASSFSRAAIQAADEYPGRPIQMVDGPHLARRMIKHRVGISEGKSLVTGKAELSVNESALVQLELACRLHVRRQKGGE